MKYTLYQIFVLFCLALCLGGCGPNTDTTPSSPDFGQTTDITLEATTDFETPAKIIRASFVPNLTASWVSQIIMVDENGDLHRTVTSGLKSQPLQKGTYIDVFGVTRKQAAGAFLALKDDGSVDAFIEIDDAGNFKPIPLSRASTPIRSFCSQSQALPVSEGGDIIWALSTEGHLLKLKLRLTDNQAASLETLLKKDSSGKYRHCSVSQNSGIFAKTSDSEFLFRYDPDKNAWASTRLTAGPSPTSEKRQGFITISETPAPLFLTTKAKALTLFDKKAANRIEISNGLSIAGVAESGFATLTSAQLGGALNSGAVLIADSQNPRMVLISRGYMMQELASKP